AYRLGFVALLTWFEWRHRLHYPVALPVTYSCWYRYKRRRLFESIKRRVDRSISHREKKNHYCHLIAIHFLLLNHSVQQIDKCPSQDGLPHDHRPLLPSD